VEVKKRKFLLKTFFKPLAFIVLVCLASYSSANLPKNISPKQAKSLTEKEAKLLFRMQKPDNRISIDEAMQISDEFANISNEKSAYRNGKKINSRNLEDAFDLRYRSSKEIKSISALLSSMKSDKYRGVDIPDTLAYILDFKDSAGFAIISADRRIDYSVLAFTRDGSFNRKTDNLGMAVYLERLEIYLLNSIAEAELQKDSLLNSILRKLEVNNVSAINMQSRAPTWFVETKIGPLISIQWGQDMPFNGALGQMCNYNPGPPPNDSRYPVGCVATTLIQIQSYWEHPIIHPASGTSWTILKSYKQYHNFNDSAHLSQIERDRRATAKLIVGNLFRQMGTTLNMNYDCDGSGANSQDAVDYFGRNGYTVSGLGNFNSTVVNNSINNGRPLLIRGCTNANGCHAWVIDGTLERKEMMNVGGTIIQVSPTEYYAYHNWGWDGRGDSVLPMGVFNSGYYNFQNDILIATMYR